MRNKWRGADIRARLGSSVIRYQGHPYFCEVEGEQIVLMDMVTRQTVHRKLPDDPGLDVSSLDLGYVNLEVPGRMAVYLERTPARRYRQGVDLNALRYTPLTTSGRRMGVEGSHMWCKGFIDSHQGIFPRFNQAIDLLSSGKAASVALSKQVAILRDGDIYKVFLQHEEAGWIRSGEKIVRVPKGDLSWVTIQALESVSKEWIIQEGVK